MADDLDRLTDAELLVLAGLVRKLVRADGQFTPAEHEAIGRIARQVTPLTEASKDGAYREGTKPGAPLGEKALYALIERAETTYPDDETLRKAALTVTRPDARAIMHAHLFDVAAADAITKGESDLLDWLENEWDLEIAGDLEGESTTVG